MLKKGIKIWMLGMVVGSCAYEFPADEISNRYTLGPLCMDKYIAIGDDFSAGYMDGALYSEGQEASIPMLIAGQINKVSPVIFNQPDIHSENGRNYYVPSNGEMDIKGKWIYSYRMRNTPEPDRVLTMGEAIAPFNGDKSELNNFAIPFLKVPQLFCKGLAENPYYERIEENPGHTVPAEDILLRRPTFFYVWLGMNDVINYAINGASSEEEGIFSEPGLTPVDAFEGYFNQMMEGLLQNNQSKGVVGNIISIRDFPYFYQYPHNFLLLKNSEIALAKGVLDINRFNQGILSYNQSAAEQDKRPLLGFEDNGSTLYPQRVIVVDNALPDAWYKDGSPIPKYRRLVEGEMALFTITPEMVTLGYGWKYPVTDKYYLSLEQMEEIEKITAEYNRIIEKKVQAYPDRLALADVASAVHEIAETAKFDGWHQVKNDTVYYADGIPIEGTLGLNSIFSLDAIHFNKRGNAFLANVFIESLNHSFSCIIPLVCMNDFAGNVYSTSY
jgi:hypothetical protein